MSNLFFLLTLFYFIYYLDLCGTPNYLAPEVLRVNMFDDAEGYGFSCDL
jgi:phosphorylase kinase gamma subunit